MIEYKCDQQSKDGTSISVLWKLGPEEVQSKYTDLWWNWSASKWWLLCVRNSIIYYTYFLKLFIPFLCYTQQLIVFVAILNSFWIFLLVCSLSEHVLLCDPPRMTQLPYYMYIYNTYSHKHNYIIYIYMCIY